MGEAMGPNTLVALHAGADHMAELEGGGAAQLATNSAAQDEEDEEAELRALRAARVQELKATKAAARFGAGVKLISQSDWTREVVDMSQSRGGTWVVVHLAHEPNPQCAAVRAALDDLARRHPSASFVSVPAASMMPEAHFHHLPAVFCYRGGALAERLIGRQVADKPGAAPTADELEWKLAGLGVLDTDLDEPPPPPPAAAAESLRQASRTVRPAVDDNAAQKQGIENDEGSDSDLDCNFDDTEKEEHGDDLGVD